MDPFVKYRKDFNRLVDAVYSTYMGYPPHTDRRDIAKLISEVKEACRQGSSLFSLEEGDVRQELRAQWISYIRSYQRNKPRTSLRQYLTRMSVWGLRDWVNKWKHTPRSTTACAIDTQAYPFSLNLSFLLYGERWSPLSSLTSHQRYLIYLKFVENKDILGIAKHLHKDRHVVSAQLQTTMEQIRRNFNA